MLHPFPSYLVTHKGIVPAAYREIYRVLRPGGTFCGCFYTKNSATIMIDAGYNYDRLTEKMSWLGLKPAAIRHILITHQDTDHVGAVEADSLDFAFAHRDEVCNAWVRQKPHDPDAPYDAYDESDDTEEKTQGG